MKRHSTLAAAVHLSSLPVEARAVVVLRLCTRFAPSCLLARTFCNFLLCVSRVLKHPRATRCHLCHHFGIWAHLGSPSPRFLILSFFAFRSPRPLSTFLPSSIILPEQRSLFLSLFRPIRLLSHLLPPHKTENPRSFLPFPAYLIHLSLANLPCLQPPPTPPHQCTILPITATLHPTVFLKASHRLGHRLLR